MARLLLALAALLLAAPGRAQQSNGASDGTSAPVQELQPFTRVEACVPFNVLVQPSSGQGPQYGLQVDAEGQAANAIQGSVQGDTLQLQTGAFTTMQPIKVVVYLPAGQLAALDLLGFGGDVYVNDGFSPDRFALRVGAGSGSAYVFNMSAARASVQTGSSGDVVLTGTFGTVDVTTSGISTVYVQGVQQAVSVDLSGISNVYVQPASSDSQITGRASGISNVVYSQGQCSVQSAFLLTSPCQQSGGISLQVPTPAWTQGLTAIGTFSCGAAGSFLSGSPQAFPTAQLPQLQFPAFQLTPISPITPIQTAPPAGQAATVPPSGPASTQTAMGAATPAAVTAPPPVPEGGFINAQNPYAFGVQGPTGSQFQAGSVGPQGTTANSAATGENQASAVSVAGPSGAQTQTSSDGSGFGAQTTG